MTTMKSYQQKYQVIDSKTRILSLLTQCIQQHSHLHLSLNRDGEFFTTQLDRLDDRQGCLYFAELQPRSGQKLLHHGQRIRAFTQVNGAELNFELKISRVKSALFRTRNCAELPKTVKYFQRRRNHRVHVSLAMGLQASLQQASGQSISGQIRDLSASGMRIQFQRVGQEEFTQLPAVKNCTIALSDGEKISCRFAIHHLQSHDEQKSFAVGGSFDALSLEHRRQLEKFIAKVERESLRAYR